MALKRKCSMRNVQNPVRSRPPVPSKRQRTDVSPSTRRMRTSRTKKVTMAPKRKILRKQPSPPPVDVSASSPSSPSETERPKHPNRIINEEDLFRARVHSFGNPVGAIEVIRGRLTATQQTMFEASCFGYFLGIKDIEFAGQLVNNMLMRQTPVDEMSVIEFNFSGTSAQRFTIEDFGRITGLNCGILPTNKVVKNLKTTKLHERLLDNRSDLTSKDILKIVNDPNITDDADILKLALLYFLVSGVMGMDPKIHIPRLYVELVDDLPVFNAYPWGRLSFQATIESLRNAFRHRGNEVKNPSCSYDLKGLPLAFQVWCYEAIPELGMKFATSSGRSTGPSILGWYSMSKPRHKDLNAWFCRHASTTRAAEGPPPQPSWARPENGDTSDRLSRLEGLMKEFKEEMTSLKAEVSDTRMMIYSFFFFWANCQNAQTHVPPHSSPTPPRESSPSMPPAPAQTSPVPGSCAVVPYIGGVEHEQSKG